MSTTPQSGVRGLEKLILSKYSIVLKLKITLNLKLNVAKTIIHIDIPIKIVTRFKTSVKVWKIKKIFIFCVLFINRHYHTVDISNSTDASVRIVSK